MAKLRKMLGDPTGPRAKTLMNQYGNASIPGRIAVCNPITLSRYHPAEARQLGNRASRGSTAAGVPRKHGSYSNAVNSSNAGPAMTPPTSVSSMPRNTIGRAGPSDQPC